MKKIMVFLALLSFSFALYPGSITIAPIEFKNFGDESLPAFNITIEVDCPEGTIDQYTESDGVPVPGAMGYLKYVQYQVPLISSKSTDSSGHAVHQLPGNVSYYTGLFTLTIEKAGYRKQEIHFDISGCFVNVTELPPTPPPNITPPPPPPPLPEPNITPPANITPNVTENITIECTDDSDCPFTIASCSHGGVYTPPRCVNGTCIPDKCTAPEPGICPLGFGGLVFSVLMVLVTRYRSNAH